jgi:hypothetical protein
MPLRDERAAQVFFALLALDVVPVPIRPEEDHLTRDELAMLLFEGSYVLGLDKRADAGFALA